MLQPFCAHTQPQQLLDIAQISRRRHRDEQPASFRIGGGSGHGLLYINAKRHALGLGNGGWAEVDLNREAPYRWIERGQQLTADAKA